MAAVEPPDRISPIAISQWATQSTASARTHRSHLAPCRQRLDPDPTAPGRHLHPFYGNRGGRAKSQAARVGMAFRGHSCRTRWSHRQRRPRQRRPEQRPRWHPLLKVRATPCGGRRWSQPPTCAGAGSVPQIPLIVRHPQFLLPLRSSQRDERSVTGLGRR